MSLPFRDAGVRLHVETSGVGEPILLVHGFLLNGSLWNPLVAELPEEWAAIVPDLRGHGGSGIGSPIDVDLLADDLARVLDLTTDGGPAVVVGFSLGGYAAMALCRRHPERRA